MFITRSTSSNSNRWGTSASRSLGPISGSSLIIVKIRSITSRNCFGDWNGLAIAAAPPSWIWCSRLRAAAGSIGLVLFVGFAVHRARCLLLRSCVVHDAGERLLVPVRCMLDQFPLGELEPLGLTSACLLDRQALFASTVGEFKQRIGRPVVDHGQTVLRWRANTTRVLVAGRALPARREPPPDAHAATSSRA